MKKRLLYLFMLISSVSLFMSCSDDDDVKYPVDSELAGAYKGTMDVYYVGVCRIREQGQAPDERRAG